MELVVEDEVVDVALAVLLATALAAVPVETELPAAVPDAALLVVFEVELLSEDDELEEATEVVRTVLDVLEGMDEAPVLEPELCAIKVPFIELEFTVPLPSVEVVATICEEDATPLPPV